MSRTLNYLVITLDGHWASMKWKRTPTRKIEMPPSPKKRNFWPIFSENISKVRVPISREPSVAQGSASNVFKMLSVNDCFNLKNGHKCAAILANPNFRQIFSNFEQRYLENRLSYSDQQNIIRNVWSSSTNYVFTTLSLKDCFTLKNGCKCATILAKISPISAVQLF